MRICGPESDDVSGPGFEILKERSVISDHQFCLFQPSQRGERYRSWLLDFMETHVYPAEAEYETQMRESVDPIITRRSLRNSNMQRANVIYGICFTPTHSGALGCPIWSTLRPRRSWEKSMAGTRSVQLQCPRYRKHGSAHTFWCRRTQGAVAETVAGGHDPLGLRDDRAVAPRYVSADSVR